MKDMFTRTQAADLVDSLNRPDEARIAYQRSERPVHCHKIELLDLTTARLRSDPLEIAFPFKSVFVEEATDTFVKVYMLLGTKEAHQDAFKLDLKASIELDYPIQKAFLYWDAQPGKSITLKAFPEARYRSGTQISVSSGGVAVNEGTAVSAGVQNTLAASAAAVIAPADSTRKVSIIQNNTSSDIWIAGTNAVSNTGATQGIKMVPGEKYEYRNTAALYGFSLVGGDVTRVDLT